MIPWIIGVPTVIGLLVFAAVWAEWKHKKQKEYKRPPGGHWPV